MRERASDWADALFGLVPEELLMPSYQAAVREHRSAFPLSAYEVKEAYLKIDAELRREQAENQRRLIERAERESPDYKECPSCFNCGFRRTFERDAWGQEHWGVVRCYDCDYWQKRKERKMAQGHYKS